MTDGVTVLVVKLMYLLMCTCANFLVLLPRLRNTDLKRLNSIIASGQLPIEYGTDFCTLHAFPAQKLNYTIH